MCVPPAQPDSLRKDFRRRLAHCPRWFGGLRSPRIRRGSAFRVELGHSGKCVMSRLSPPHPRDQIPLLCQPAELLNTSGDSEKGAGKWHWFACLLLLGPRGESGQARVPPSAACRKRRGGPRSSCRRGEGRGPRLGPGHGRAARAELSRPCSLGSPARGGGAGAARGAPASRLPPPARGGSGGARCKQSGGRDVSRSHGASYGSGWLSAGGQLRQLLLWLGRRRRGSGRGGSGIGPSALPALSAPRLK